MRGLFGGFGRLFRFSGGFDLFGIGLLGFDRLDCDPRRVFRHVDAVLEHGPRRHADVAGDEGRAEEFDVGVEARPGFDHDARAVRDVDPFAELRVGGDVRPRQDAVDRGNEAAQSFPLLKRAPVSSAREHGRLPARSAEDDPERRATGLRTVNFEKFFGVLKHVRDPDVVLRCRGPFEPRKYSLCQSRAAGSRGSGRLKAFSSPRGLSSGG